ncbi:hypothetical protein HDU87_004582 [Geranomyces variabilis]|uniref:Uncharacterized protein n=1 Tax=Geranomyces variabilis TaxID=109894 RepID=A0AAD5XLV8_9FUNG|nr:hypothetical protein HDU87_004582 [Geranomyces variabilis]
MADPYAAAVAAVATATSQALAAAAAATGSSSSSSPFPQRNMDNVVQSNQPLMLNGHPVYELSRVKDLMLRTAAATLLVCLLVVWLQTFSNKRSAVSLLVAATIATELTGVIVGLLPKISTLLPNTPLVSVVVGVGCFMFSAECFNWVLYLRFSIVAAPFAKGRFTRVMVRTWLAVESAMVVANYAYWIQQSYAEAGDTHAANDVYYYLSIIQAATALGLSSYFVATYYYPRLKLTARQSGGVGGLGGGGAWALVAQFATTGLLYLVLETLLHCSYTVTSTLLPSVRTGLTAFLTASRYATFMMFVLALRSDTAAGRRRRTRSRLLLPPLLHERKLSSDNLEIIRHNYSNDAAPKQQNNKQHAYHHHQQQQQQQQRQQRRRWPFFPSIFSPDSPRGGRPQMGKAHKPSAAANYLYHNHHHRQQQQHLRHQEVDPKGTFEDWSIDMEPDDLTILRPAPAAARAGEFAR